MKPQQRDEQDLRERAQDVVRAARTAGADVAECVLRRGSHLTTRIRRGETELVEEAGSNSIGLRVMVGQQVAGTYTNDFSKAGIEKLVDDAVELAKLSQPDEFAGAPDPSLLTAAADCPDLNLFDDKMNALDVDDAIAIAKIAEKAAFDSDPRITNSKGATVSRASSSVAVVTSGGFSGSHSGTYASLVVTPVADDNVDGDIKRRTGSFWAARRHLAELENPKSIGEEAARRTLRSLGAKKIDTQEVPVVFDPDAAGTILGLLGGCILGGSIWRKSSYLADRLNTEVASSLISVIDDPLIPKAPGSRPYDGEGLASRQNVIVENGVLKSYLLDSYCGRRLKMESTASASRGSSGGVSPSASNFILQPGSMTHDELLKSTPRGLYVTSMMGFGFSGVTGDFSRGASGFWIENGELAFPVSEVTISLNLDTLLKRIDAIADDLDLRSSVASPSFRVSGMTVAGKS